MKIILLLIIPISILAQNISETTIHLSQIKDTSVVIIENNPFMPYPTSLYKNSIRIGAIEENGIEYRCVVFELDKEKYNKYSFIWLDKLSNNKFDYIEDHIDQMYVPFTLNGNSFLVTEIDSLGRSIKIRRCDISRFPPIEVGKQAPNIIAQTFDGNKFALSEVHQKYRAVYFWGCMLPLHFREFNIVQEHFKNDDIRFICLSSKDDYLKSKPVNWTHICLDGWNDPIRIKYQVGSLPQLFVLNENNEIKYILKEVQSRYLIEAIENIIK